MQIPRSVLLIPAAVGFASALAAPSCTATTGPSFPSGALPVPASYTTLAVTQLPAACAGQTYFAASTSLCPAGLSYLLCDGVGYTEYDCADPGAGWTQETLGEDNVATDPGPCGAATPGVGLAALDGTVYVEGNQRGPGENSILVFRYCHGTMPASVVAQYSTGGTGSADLNNTGILDADQQVVVNGAGTLLYAVNQGSDTIAAFHIMSDGLLTKVAGSPFKSGGVGPISVGVSGNVLLVANKAADGIRDLSNVAPNYTTFLIQTDGSLKPSGSTFALDPGASPTQAYVAPGGRLVFATEESGLLRALQLSVNGELTLAPGSPVGLPDALFPHGRPSPVWPAGLSALPNKPFFYTGIPNNGSIATVAFTDTGKLTILGGEADRNATLPCWSVTSPDGRRLYFANAGSDNISVWDTESDPSHPSLLETFTLEGGGNPWGMHIDETGQLMFAITPRQVKQVPEGQGQLLHGLAIAQDGTLQEVPGSPVPIPVAAATNPFGVTVVSLH